MKDVTMQHIDHPLFANYQTLGDDQIAVFRVGYYEDVPANVVEAAKKIEQALVELETANDLIRAYSGHLVYYSPTRNIINPAITDLMRHEFIAAAEAANPDWQCITSWDNHQHGLSGYSVRLRRRT